MIRTNGRHPYLMTRRQPGRMSRSLFSLLRDHGKMLIFCLLFAAGVVMGTLLVWSVQSSILDYLGQIAGSFLDNRLGQTAMNTFLSSFYASLIFLVLLFFLGFCAVSAPLILAVPIFKGLGLGFSIGHFIMNYGTQGILFSLVILLPPALVQAFAVCLGCKEAFDLSTMLLSAITSESGRGGMSERSRQYCKRFFVLVVLAACGALLDVILATVLSGVVVL